MTTPLKNKKGFTLVELIVCLVLLSLFGVAAVTLIKPSANAYITVQQLSRAQNLADALVETVRGEVNSADGTLSIVKAAAGAADKDSVFSTDRLNQGTGLRFTVENSYVEVLDAGYVPTLYGQKADSGITYVPPKEKKATDATTYTELENYLHMRFYKVSGDGTIQHTRQSGGGTGDIDCAYAYTTAYPNGDYMGLVISDLQFYARGWKEVKLTDEDGKETGATEIRLTSLTMTVTVAEVTQRGKKGEVTATNPLYTQTAVIPLPGEPVFN